MEQIQLETLNCTSTNTQGNIQLREIVLYRLLLVLHIRQVAVFGLNEASLNSSAYFFYQLITPALSAIKWAHA